MKISIITPCRNSEKTIKRTIDSVIEQKLIGNELEYIIVDGQSSDNTLAIIKEYALTNKCIKYISEKDNSMTEALNKGMKLATGDVVASINADDTYLPGTLQKVCEEYTKQKGDILMINTYFVRDGGFIKSHNTPKKFSPFICGLMECPFPECAIFFKRNCVTDMGFFNEKIKYTQDLEMYLRQYKAGYKFWYADIDGSCFFVSDTNYSSTISSKMKEEVLTFFEHKWMYNHIATSNILSKLLKASMGYRHYYLIKRIKYNDLY